MRPIHQPKQQAITTEMHLQAGFWLLGMALVIEFTGLVVITSMLLGFL